MPTTYEAMPYGTAYGVFRSPVDPDRPVLVLYDAEAAADLATAMTWAAEDRQRHTRPADTT